MEFILIWIGCAIVCAVVASAKGRSGGGWFFLGLIFGIFAVLVIAFLPSNKPVQVYVADAGSPTTYGGKEFSPLFQTKKCPDCAESILKDANVCKHCGYRFGPVHGQ